MAGARLRLHRVLVDIDGIQNLEDEVLAPKTRRDRASAVQRHNACHNAVLGRAHGMTELLSAVFNLRKPPLINSVAQTKGGVFLTIFRAPSARVIKNTTKA